MTYAADDQLAAADERRAIPDGRVGAQLWTAASARRQDGTHSIAFVIRSRGRQLHPNSIETTQFGSQNVQYSPKFWPPSLPSKGIAAEVTNPASD